MLNQIESIQQLKDQFDPASITRGMNYFREGRVLESHHQRGVVTGTVRGTKRTPYEVYILLSKAGNRVLVDGDCTCPVGINCKHVVSVLQDQIQQRRDSPSRADSGKGARRAGDPALALWELRLEETLTPSATAKKAIENPNCLLYLLEPADGQGEATVHLLVCRRLKKRGYGKPTPFSIERAWQPYPPDYLGTDDLEILRSLFPHPHRSAGGKARLSGENGAVLLEALLQTGRCHWLEKDSTPLKPAPARHGAPEWEPMPDGRQRLIFRSIPPTDRIFPTLPPWYLDLKGRCCGPLQSDLEPKLATALATAPPLAPEQVAPFNALLKQRFPSRPFPKPLKPRIEELRAVPTPRLHLLELELSPTGDDVPAWYPATLYQFTAARLEHDYAGHALPFDEADGSPLCREGQRLLRIKRDRRAEERNFRRLEKSYNLAPLGELCSEIPEQHRQILAADDPYDERQFWLSFQHQALPELRAEGWEI